jgi:hypothetical protein
MLHATIEDKDEYYVGQIKPIGLAKKHLLLFDEDDSLIIKADKAVWSLSKSYEIKNSEKKLLGNIKEKLFDQFYKMIESPNGKVLLSISGLIKDKEIEYFEVKDTNEKIIAKFGYPKKKQVGQNILRVHHQSIFCKY